MNKIFAPAFLVIARLTLPLNCVLIMALFLLPNLLGIGLFLTGANEFGLPHALTAILTLLAVYYAVAICLWFNIGMQRIGDTVDRIASGDLTSRVAVLHRDTQSEAARLGRSLDQMSASLADIVSQVRNSAEAIVAMAKDIADGHTSLSHRTQEQASSLEETVSGTEELAATVKQNANSCSRANALAGNASQVAGKAAEQMRQVAQMMKQIDESSRRVADILSVIEGIAFQTNILALNAAIEAARAGDQGRGFAVVAAEVRGLAQRSAEAAKEIKALIEASVGNVAQGRQLVNATGATMNDVVTGVQQVTEVIGEIAHASSEQGAGVEGINNAIVQIDSVTQQNAALVEEAAAAALAFEEEAARLADVVAIFKVDRMEERNRAVALVKEAVAHVRDVGLVQALKDFNQPKGEFNDGKYYIWAGDYNGVTLANGGDPTVCGQNHYEVKSADGRKFVQEVIQAAKTKGKGWCDYLWKNPATGRTEQKSTYFEAVDNTFLSCGIYKGKKEIIRATAAPRPTSKRKVANLPPASSGRRPKQKQAL